MSSRTLIRALEGYFSGALRESEFYEVVEQFHAKHNTMNLIATMSFDINNELLKCYNEYVAGDDSLELRFIEVLGTLCRVFSVKAIQKWVELYIKPAFDTGVDLRFIKRAKEFLAKLVVILPTPDPELSKLRHSVAKMVITNILKVYLEDERGVIKDQCITWLQGVVGLQPDNGDLLSVLSTEFKVVNLRYGLVLLISALDPSIVIHDPLWSALLCLLEADLSKAVVDGVLQIVTKAIPFVTDTKDWNRIMASVVKRINWGQFVDDYAELVEKRTQWPIAAADMIEGDSGDATAYLATMLYGLNPREFLAVAGGDVGPIKQELAYQLTRSPDLAWLEQLATHMIVHPQLVDGSVKPWAWVKDKDITAACFSLCHWFPEAQQHLMSTLEPVKSAPDTMFEDHERIFTGSTTVPATPDTSVVLGDSEKSDYHLQELLLVRNQLSFVKYLKQITDTKLAEARKQSNGISVKNTPVVAKAMSPSSPSSSDPELTVDVTEIVSRLQLLQTDNSTLKQELQDAHDKLDSVQTSYKKLCEEDIPQKNATIERLNDRLEELQGVAEIPQQLQTTLVSGPKELQQEESSWLEELDAVKNENLQLVQQQGELEARVKQLEKELLEAQSSETAKVEAAKEEVRKTISEYLNHYDRRIEELQAAVRKFQAVVADRDAKIAQLLMLQPIQIPGQHLAESDAASNKGY